MDHGKLLLLLLLASCFCFTLLANFFSCTPHRPPSSSTSPSSPPPPLPPSTTDAPTTMSCHRRHLSRIVRELQSVRVSGNSIFVNPDVESPLQDSLCTEKCCTETAVAATAIATPPTPPSPPAPPTPFPPLPAMVPCEPPPVAPKKGNLHSLRESIDVNMAGATAEDREIIQNKLINEEYKVWKKNSVFLYDIMYSRALDWPTLTTQWLPDVKAIPGKPFRTHRLLLGTHTSNAAQDFLQIAHISLPLPPAMTMADYNPLNEELGGHGAAKEPMTFSVVQKIPHKGEVNKARYQPQNPDIIATWSPDHNVYIWDRAKHPSVPGLEVKPQATLKGHSGEGFAVEWNPFVEGQLISGSEDKTVNLWDLQQDYNRENTTISPARTFTHHSAVVNDVQYHPAHGKNLFGSVSDDLTMCLMDTRAKTDNKPAIHFKNAHTDAINSLSFHPKYDKLFATGAADKTIGIFDLRFPEHGKIHSLEGHHDVITKVDWHPIDSAIIASSSDDRRIVFWDISRGGAEQTPEDAEDGPPEMLFMHGGHTNRISDFSWNKNDPWVMCSTGEDNLIQCWRASRHLVETLPAGVQRREVSES